MDKEELFREGLESGRDSMYRITYRNWKRDKGGILEDIRQNRLESE